MNTPTFRSGIIQRRIFVILDTNIFISALLRDSEVRRLIVNSPVGLIFPENILDEMREHEGELLEKSGITKEAYETLINKLLTYVEVLPVEELKPYRDRALQIIGKIDKDDVTFFAAALAINDAIIWSDDKKLKTQEDIIVLNTREIIQLFRQQLDDALL